MMWFGGGWWLMWLLPLALIGLVVWAILDRSSGTRVNGVRGNGADRAEDIARERYARGEIDEHELEQILSKLRSS